MSTEFEKFIRRERRILRRIAFHEIGHAVAMYVCYGNIERIDSISCDLEHPGTIHSNPIGDVEYIGKIIDDNHGFQFALNEICYAIGGGFCEAMFCNNISERIRNNKKYKFPIKGMKDDLQDVERILLILGATERKEINSFIVVSVRRLFPYFIKYEEKIRKLVDKALKEDYYLSRIDFYEVFDEKLYKKELARLRKKLKSK